ncbi:MAG TPA: hypothetical protein VG873_16305 [Burkholderiales bacterium]|jgi:hypothetical protein|nr:hypothetical protein [Burkholderiales bacterium]
MQDFKMPSAEELYAYEVRARRERAKAQGALAAAAFAWLRQALVTVFTKPYATKGMRHA